MCASDKRAARGVRKATTREAHSPRRSPLPPWRGMSRSDIVVAFHPFTGWVLTTRRRLSDDIGGKVWWCVWGGDVVSRRCRRPGPDTASKPQHASTRRIRVYMMGNVPASLFSYRLPWTISRRFTSPCINRLPDRHLLRGALKKAVQNGRFVKVKASFALAVSEGGKPIT